MAVRRQQKCLPIVHNLFGPQIFAGLDWKAVRSACLRLSALLVPKEFLSQRAAREVDARKYAVAQREAAEAKRLREAEHVAEVQRQINLRATQQRPRPGAM
eukprot:528052-Amphidinium_carterae.1